MQANYINETVTKFIGYKTDKIGRLSTHYILTYILHKSKKKFPHVHLKNQFTTNASVIFRSDETFGPVKNKGKNIVVTLPN